MSGQVANLDGLISIEFTTSDDVMIVSDTHWAFSRRLADGDPLWHRTEVSDPSCAQAGYHR